jgi:hypothetical protein
MQTRGAEKGYGPKCRYARELIKMLDGSLSMSKDEADKGFRRLVAAVLHEQTTFTVIPTARKHTDSHT